MPSQIKVIPISTSAETRSRWEPHIRNFRTKTPTNNTWRSLIWAEEQAEQKQQVRRGILQACTIQITWLITDRLSVPRKNTTPKKHLPTTFKGTPCSTTKNSRISNPTRQEVKSLASLWMLKVRRYISRKTKEDIIREIALNACLLKRMHLRTIECKCSTTDSSREGWLVAPIIEEFNFKIRDRCPKGSFTRKLGDITITQRPRRKIWSILMDMSIRDSEM